MRLHAPSKCNVIFGGFVFDNGGNESKQLDVIVITDTTPQFNFNNRDGNGKSFSPVEGTLGVISIKSTLDKHGLEDALSGIASIPLTRSLEGRILSSVKIKDYNDWPCKVIYASDGIRGDRLLAYVNDYYLKNPNIPIYRRPNLIHVGGKYIIFRISSGMSMWDRDTKAHTKLAENSFQLFTSDSDLQGIIWLMADLQEKATESIHIIYKYKEIINKVNGVPTPESETSLL